MCIYILYTYILYINISSSMKVDTQTHMIIQLNFLALFRFMGISNGWKGIMKSVRLVWPSLSCTTGIKGSSNHTACHRHRQAKKDICTEKRRQVIRQASSKTSQAHETESVERQRKEKDIGLHFPDGPVPIGL